MANLEHTGQSLCICLTAGRQQVRHHRLAVVRVAVHSAVIAPRVFQSGGRGGPGQATQPAPRLSPIVLVLCTDKRAIISTTINYMIMRKKYLNYLTTFCTLKITAAELEPPFYESEVASKSQLRLRIRLHLFIDQQNWSFAIPFWPGIGFTQVRSWMQLHHVFGRQNFLTVILMFTFAFTPLT